MTSSRAVDEPDTDDRVRGRRRALAALVLALGLTALLMALRSGSGDPAAAATPGGGERVGAVALPDGGVLPPGTSGTSVADRRQAGQELYLTSCVSCHGVDGVGGIPGTGVEGDKQPDVSAPSLIASGEASADFYLRTGRMPLAGPTPQPADKPPAYNDSQIKDLVAYVGSLCDRTKYPCPQIPPVDPALGNLQEGGDLFLANCAPCHNSIAVGGALSYGRHAPTLQETDAPQVGEAIRIGPGQMPQFGPEVFTDQQVDSIVRYVEYLHDPEHPGGAPLGYTGPVAEGFVALLLGLGSLIYVIRWITRERPVDDDGAMAPVLASPTAEVPGE